MDILLQAFESVKEFFATDLSLANIGALMTTGYAGFMTWFSSRIKVQALTTNNAVADNNAKLDTILANQLTIINLVGSVKQMLQAVELMNVTMAQSSNLPISAKNEIVQLHTTVQSLTANVETLGAELQQKIASVQPITQAQTLLEEKKTEVNNILDSTLAKVKSSLTTTLETATNKAVETITGVNTPTL
jgi:hypothetical protein